MSATLTELGFADHDGNPLSTEPSDFNATCATLSLHSAQLLPEVAALGKTFAEENLPATQAAFDKLSSFLSSINERNKGMTSLFFFSPFNHR